ncbi:MAG: bifunctional hydroxymethylpyrimidine kinase/phosphomethylpyrimidine kinase [Clostridium sp.]
MNTVLTIAGSDCSGGAGIQADLKTFAMHRCYGMSVITSLTAQNTTGVYGILDSTEEFVENQIDCVFNDILPLATKIGMVSSRGIVQSIYNKLVEYKAENIVVDPVMVSTSNGNLIKGDAIEELVNKLFKIAAVVTPNISEAEVLSNIKIDNMEDMKKAAIIISKTTLGGVLIKGGHLDGLPNDVLYYNGEFTWYSGKRINNPNTHGTGCTLSSAIACNLAEGNSLDESIRLSKDYVEGAIASGLNLGKGRGPLDHTYTIK